MQISKQTFTYVGYTFAALLSLAILYFLSSFLWNTITYANQHEEFTTSINATSSAIKSNSNKRNEIEDTINQLRKEQQLLQDTNNSLRSELSTIKQDYEEFLGFH